MTTWGKNRRTTAWTAVVALSALSVVTLSGCGGGGSSPDVGVTSTTSVGSAAGTTPEAGAAGTTSVDGAAEVTRTVRVTTTVKGKVTTVTGRPSALDGLQRYLSRVSELDGRLAAAAKLVNGDIGPSGMTIRPATRRAISAIELTGVAQALPAGMNDALTGRALLVYSDLSSRRYALQGVLRATPGPDGIARVPKAEMGEISACLAAGAPAKARFAGDVAALRSLAASSKAFTAPPASSRASGAMVVRARYIDGWNSCCGSCGGYVSDQVAPVVWQAKDLSAGEHIDGTVNGVGFEASYTAAHGWQAVIHAG